MQRPQGSNGTSGGANGSSGGANGTSGGASGTSEGANGLSGGNQGAVNEIAHQLRVFGQALFLPIIQPHAQSNVDPQQPMPVGAESHAAGIDEITKLQKEMFANLEDINSELESQAMLVEDFSDAIGRVVKENWQPANYETSELHECVEEISGIRDAMAAGLRNAQRLQEQFRSKQGKVSDLLEQSKSHGQQ